MVIASWIVKLYAQVAQSRSGIVVLLSQVAEGSLRGHLKSLNLLRKHFVASCKYFAVLCAILKCFAQKVPEKLQESFFCVGQK